MSATNSNMDNEGSIASRTRSKGKLNPSAHDTKNNTSNDMINHATQLWAQLNDALSYVPSFQNIKQLGVSEERIRRIESKLNVTLPTEIRAAIRAHDGRKKIGFGLSYRLATTDLLPIAQWRPYETDNDEYEILFECLTSRFNQCVAAELKDDVRNHLNAYIKGMKEAKTKYKITDDQTFHAVPCELLIIGEGMDDYVEQYLLSVQTGRIYLAIHNIPEWKLIGTFADWIKMGIENAKDDRTDILESHAEIEDE